MEGRAGGRGRFGGPPARVTKSDGVNRFVWDVRNQSGLAVPPGAYQVRLKVGDITETQPLNVRIDPRVAADGVTDADLREQFEHNTRIRELVSAVDVVAARLRDAQGRLRDAAGADADTAKRVTALAAQVFTEPVRYGKPGLQAHINYLAGMTNAVDQKIGRDAIERYQTLKKELDAIRMEVDRVLGVK
jgi:hypothetical protein